MSEQTPNTAANDVEQLIRDQIRDNKVILYMKGTPQFPQCGFSAKAIEVLTQIGRPFAFVNILENPEIRATLPKIANWPTFPQLWIVRRSGTPKIHRRSLIDDQQNRPLALLGIDAHVWLAQSRSRLPIHRPNVVARSIVA